MEFVPDSNRAMFLQGRIDQALVDRLTPEIVRLHTNNPQPITVFVDSPGGFISSGRRLFDLVKAPNLNGDKGDLIVVVTGTAASAAADFMALADYAYLYPHSLVLYHGTRQDSQQSMTVADAQTLAESLRQTNETYALPLARKAVERFILRLNSFPKEFQEFLHNQQAGLDALIKAVSVQLGSNARHMVQRALERQHALQELTQAAMVHLKRFKRQMTDNEFEAQLLIGILQSKIKLHKSRRWRLSEGRLSELDADFRLLHDFHFGDQNSELHRLVAIYGETFLLKDEQQDPILLEDRASKTRQDWITAKARPRLQALWYLCVSMSRLLQDDDHWLSAYDAYWLGLADEIIGANLPNLRELLNGSQSPVPASATET